MSMDIAKLQSELAEFASKRDWDQFHSPRNLASALVVEAEGLLERFQWMSEGESMVSNLTDQNRSHIKEERADDSIFLIRLADKLSVDLPRAIGDKIRLNREKYPVELAKGNAIKYSER